MRLGLVAAGALSLACADEQRSIVEPIIRGEESDSPAFGDDSRSTSDVGDAASTPTSVDAGSAIVAPSRDPSGDAAVGDAAPRDAGRSPEAAEQRTSGDAASSAAPPSDAEPPRAPARSADAASPRDAGPPAPAQESVTPPSDATAATAPELAVVFPIEGALLSSELTVRGRTSDGGDIARITVAGVDAQSDDDFATWQATLPIEAGEQTLEVVAFGESGQQTRRTMTIDGWTELGTEGERGAGKRRDPYGLYRLTRSPDGEHVYIADNIDDGLFIIETRSGDRLSLGSEEGMGSGFEPVRPTDVVLTGARDTAWLLDEGRIVELDLARNHRELIAAATAGTGHAFGEYSTLVWDVERARAVAAQRSPAALVTIDAQTHERELLSGDGVGDGRDLKQPMALAVDAQRDEAIVAGQYQSVLWAVDLEDGSRRVWRDFTAGPIAPSEVALLAFATATDELLVWDRAGRLYAYRAQDGAARVVSQQLAAGVELGAATGMAVADELVWLYLDEHQALVALDLVTGQSVIVSR